LPPDDLLASYRLPSMAWNQEQDDNGSDASEFVLSAGWQSDFALFITNPNTDMMVHPRELAEKSESEADAIVEAMAASSITLPPKLPKGLTTTTTTTNPDDTPPYWSVMQKQGDLLLIPAHR
jgi:hypothetical protein